MQLARFLNKVFKDGGFILTDANYRDYIIGKPGNDPIKLRIFKSENIKSKSEPKIEFDLSKIDVIEVQ